jgi:multidrug efflux pump
MGGFVDAEDSRPMPGVEWQVTVDRAQAAKFGLDVTAVGDSIRLVTNGLKVGEFRPDDSRDEVDIVIRYPTDARSLSNLDQIRVQTPSGSVPISNFIQRVPVQRVNKIDRVDGMRVMTVKSDVAPGILPDNKVQEIRGWLEAAKLDPRVSITFKGEDEEQKESQEFLTAAFGAGIFLIAIILLTQFNSFYSAGLILSAVAMSTIGVFIGLLVTGQPFGIVMTGIGVIALAGIVVQNNIVLIDTYDQYRQSEPTEYDAILRTGAERLRPVLLTALNTVLGLLPLTMGVNIDLFTREVTVGAPATQWWTQLSTAICFGLTFATVLTLIVTPAALMLRANVRAWWARRRGRGKADAFERAPANQQLPEAAE